MKQSTYDYKYSEADKINFQDSIDLPKKSKAYLSVRYLSTSCNQ